MDATSPPVAGSKPWPVLNANERRVLGVLVEKAKTTPDAYPLSLNGLVTGSNQKSNRDPVLNLDEVDIEDALQLLQKKGIVLRVTSQSSRVDKWRHQIGDSWSLNRVELALIAELLLRGPQTEGELRTRVSRMEPFDDLEQLRTALQPLADRGLVVYLTPQGRRGTTLTHGFHPPEEIQLLKKRLAVADAETGGASVTASPSGSSVSAEWERRLAQLQEEMQTLRQDNVHLKSQLEDLQQLVNHLQSQLAEVRRGLGL